MLLTVNSRLRFFLGVFLAALCMGGAGAQTVTNVRAAQRAGTKLVDVYYDLSDGPGPSTVAVAVSDNGGASYTVPATSLSGAVGGGVNAGLNKHVVWNAGADWNGQFSQAVRFRITASGTPTAPEGFALIPAGWFTMGRTSGDTDGDAPPVSVYVSAFYMAKYEVTKSLWDEVRTWGLANGYTDLPAGGGKAANHPVHSINWYAMVKWCNARSQKEGFTPCYSVSGVTYKTGNSDTVACNWSASGYRLPTEAEWEKAARGGQSGLRFPWGDTITHSQANYYSSNDYSYDTSPTRGPHPDTWTINIPYTAPVGSFAANGYGLYDMVGNVWERCWDLYSASYYTSGLSDPSGPVSGSNRVIRGGSCVNDAIYARCAIRGNLPPGGPFTSIGFRPARSFRITPIVFIPGIAGSVLKEQWTLPVSALWQRWPPALASMRTDIEALNLRKNGDKNIKAVDVVRHFWTPADLSAIKVKIPFLDLEISLEDNRVYEPFIEHFAANQDYKEFLLQDDPGRLTSNYMLEYAQNNPNEPKPTFFPFPYDWRKSNAEHTATLDQYLQRISELHGGAKVSIVAHSMGGLLLRRYLLDYGTDKVDKVATIASPFWGAPVAVYRMLTGDFFDISLLDSVSSEEMKQALVSLPGALELLPSNTYLQQTGSILSEDGWDFDGDGGTGQSYSLSHYWTVLDQKLGCIQRTSNPGLPIETPSALSSTFHTIRQNSSFNDSTLAPNITVPTLHLYGRQIDDKTPVAVVAKARSAWHPESFFGNRYYFETVKGPGDETVPILSAARHPSHVWPEAEMRQIWGAKDANHNGLMKNPLVWGYLDDFLDDGLLNLSSPATATAQAMTAPDSATGRIHLLVLGAGYVKITDGNGNQNARINDIAVAKIPDMEIHYGGDQPWVIIEYTAGNSLTIEPESGSDSLEIQITLLDPEGIANALRRYRFAPNEAAWRLELDSAESSTLKLDANGDGNLDAEETIPPSHDVSGGTVDTEQPRISLQLSLSAEAITVTLTGEDGEQPAPNLFYSLDTEAVHPYAAPLEFPSGTARLLKVYAEDAAGNTSGLIETAIHPKLSSNLGTDGTITLAWPMADAYSLEESTSLEEGSWTRSSLPVTRSDFTDSATIPTDSIQRKFFRLHSRTATK